MKMIKNEDVIIEQFKLLYSKLINGDILDIRGTKSVEILDCNMKLNPRQKILDFGIRKTPIEYAKRELIWYDSMDLSVNTISEYAKMWKIICDKDGHVNSNYGWCIYSDENYNQYNSCLKTLNDDRYSRRATMIYNRPSMQLEYNKNGRNDFICTNRKSVV